MTDESAEIAATRDHERSVLRQIIDTITTDRDLDKLLQGVAEVITGATGTDVCFVHLLNDEGRALTLSGATPPFDELAGKVHLTVGDGVAGWVAQHREPVTIVDDKRSDPRYVYIPELRGEDYTSLVSVPMITSSNRLVGVLNVHRRERHEFTPGEVAQLQSIANLMAGAVENAQLHRQVALRERSRERFAERLIEAQENERQRLARDIHDGISQRVVGLSFHLSAAASAVTDDPVFAAEQLAAAKELADATLDEARTAIAGLRPSVLDDLGFAAGLESLARSLPNLEAELRVDEARVLADHVATALYRIAQEAMQNVVKHANASMVRITFEVGDEGAVLEIGDDGDGFEVDGSGDDAQTYGLTGMHERAELIDARLDVRSSPGRGTSVRVTVPLD